MKLRILLIAIVCLFSAGAFAQKHGSDKDKEQQRKEMAEFKMQYLAEEIDLKEDQKKQFNEVYTQMEQERRAIFKRIKKAEKSISDNKKATEADYEKANKEITEARNQMALVDKKYEEKLSTFLTKKQMYELKAAEQSFMDKVRNCRDKKIGEKRDKR